MIRKYGQTIVQILHYPRITLSPEKCAIQFFDRYTHVPYEVVFTKYDEAYREFIYITQMLETKYKDQKYNKEK